MAEKTWRPFPLWVYTTENGDEFVLPGDREFGHLEENIRALEFDVKSLRDKKEKERADTVEQMVDRESTRLALLRETTEKFKSAADKQEFELSKPTFTEYLDAEEEAKDWIVGEPRVNEGKFAKRLLANNVRLKGEVLNETAVGELDPMIATKLWEEMKTKVRPNAERLPFLSSPSTKPLKAN